jgi:hypothetical protein
MPFEHSKFRISSLFGFEDTLKIEISGIQWFHVIKGQLNIILNSLGSEIKSSSQFPAQLNQKIYHCLFTELISSTRVHN